MSRKNYWNNADGLRVGFGTRTQERQEAGVHNTLGKSEEARLDISWQSGSGATNGAFILIPAGSAVKNVRLEVDQSFAGGTSITFGDAADADGWITATAASAANLATAGRHIPGDGVYAVAATTPPSQQVPKVYATDTKLFITVAGTFTAGRANIVVEYTI